MHQIVALLVLSVTVTQASVQIPTSRITHLELLNEFILSFKNTTETKQCQEDLKSLANALKRLEIWAQMVLDSQHTMPPSGLLVGKRYLLGRYEECIDQVPTNETFKMQYCLVKVDIPAVHNYYTTLPDEPLEHTIYYGLCSPSSCTSNVLNIALNSLNVPITGFELSDYAKFLVQPQHCHTNGEEITYTTDTWIILTILSTFSIWCLLCTIYRAFSQKETHKVIKAFCILNNWELIQEETKCSIACVVGIASLGGMWMHTGTVARLYFAGPISNLQEVYQLMVHSRYLPWNNAPYGEDMLLLVAGLLVVMKFADHIDKNKQYDHLLAVIRVYIRWTIPLAISVFYVASLMTQCGSGGAWNLVMDKIAGSCQTRWYYPLLYIQNYLNDIHQCLRTTWLLAAEMQLFWLSPIILFPMLWRPGAAILLSGSLAVVAAATEYYIAQENNLGPTYNFTSKSSHLLLDYIKTHTRAAPWFIGCTLGMILVSLRKRQEKLKISTKLLTIGWMISIIFLTTAFFSILAFDREYKQPYAAIVLAVNRLLWGTGIAWIIFTCATGHAKPLNVFLTWRPFHFFYNLTIYICITHEFVITYYIALTREPQHIYPFRLFSFSCALYIIAIMVSIILSVIIAQPLKHLEKMLMSSVKIYPWPTLKQVESNGVQNAKRNEDE